MSVTTVREEYANLLPEVLRNQAASIGQRAIKEGTTTYLYPLASMLNDKGEMTADGLKDYNVMLQRTNFLNATGRTIDGVSGLVFAKPYQLDLPAQLEYLKDNIDGSGNTLRNSMETTVRHSCVAPWCGLLVDHPDVEGNISRAQQEALNIRPKIIRFDFQAIINWDYQTINNECVLSLLVLVEKQSVRVNKFETEEKTFYRVLELDYPLDDEGNKLSDNVVYMHSLYEEEELTVAPTPVIANGEYLTEIPFYWVRTGYEDKALLSDLVDVNLNHYNMNASYTNKEFVSGFPIFTGTGIGDDELPSGIGPGCFWYSNSADAQYGLLESSSDGGSLRQYLEDRKSEMASLGAEMFNPNKMVAETENSKKLDKQAQNSVIASLAINTAEAYQKAFNTCAMMMGINQNATLSINTDYGVTSLTAQDRQAYMLMVQQGYYPLEALFEILKRAGDLAPEMKYNEYLNQLREDNGMGGMPNVSGDK